MSLHHLDPRTAGVQTPDVKVVWHERIDDEIQWTCMLCDRLQILSISYDSAAAALKAARAAAGFGHVAEQPCSAFQPHLSAVCGIPGECSQCAWPRAAHRKD